MRYIPGSDVETILIQPDGTEINRNTQNDKVKHILNETQEIYMVSEPLKGEWIVRLVGTDTEEGGEDTSLSIYLNESTTINQIPFAVAGSEMTVSAGDDCSAIVTLDGSGSFDPENNQLSYYWTWENGSANGMNPSISLPIGTTTVSLLVSDGTKISEPSNVEITVEDTTPPVIESFTVNPDTLWPPNHKMVPIEVTITATDNCDALPTVELTSITMDEEDETNTYDPNYDDTSGDGHTLDDIQVEADGKISLRAERSGTGDGRIYTVIYSATDASGNNATAQAIVTVPHNQ